MKTKLISSVVCLVMISILVIVHCGSEEEEQDGTLKWSFSTGVYSGVTSSPAIDSDGTIYVGSTDRNLYAINANGSLRWSFTTSGQVLSSPAIGSNGTIYVGSGDNNLYAIHGSGNLANTPWPMFHHDLKHIGRVDGGY